MTLKVQHPTGRKKTIKIMKLGFIVFYVWPKLLLNNTTVAVQLRVKHELFIFQRIFCDVASRNTTDMLF